MMMEEKDVNNDNTGVDSTDGGVQKYYAQKRCYRRTQHCTPTEMQRWRRNDRMTAMAHKKCASPAKMVHTSCLKMRLSMIQDRIQVQNNLEEFGVLTRHGQGGD
mmetsp:Transcript_2045/g.4463  ORF Transcript_2045/g.4463 Transcript_2045/m.4463 type:complete len:104 (-) Transcript_2045:39-350(-)